MSFHVKANGNLHVDKDTLFPLLCPECPAYIPLQHGMTKQTVITCWNCQFKASLEFFLDGEAEFEFIKEKVH